MNYIDESHLDDLALGAVFLATGGGGDPYLPKLLTAETLKTYGPVRLISPNDLENDAHVVTLGGVGAPTVSLELLPSIDDSLNTLNAYESHTNKKVDALAAFEIGGGNSLIPLMAAAGKGIPIIDGDGMGRALPEAQMMTYAIFGAKPTPAVAYDYEGNITIFNSKTTETYERHIRSLALASGGMITTAEHPMSGEFVKRAIIPGTLSFSIKLGELLRTNKGNAEQLLAPLKTLFASSIYGECHLLYCGKVTDKATRIEGGFDIGEATICDFSHHQEAMKISIKNEFLVAFIGDRLVASVPDLIVLVDYESGSPINAERLRYGQRVAVFAVGCPQVYRTEAALRAAGPRCFGFDIDYVPIESMAKN